MRTTKFWLDAFERAVKTFAVSLLAAIAVYSGFSDVNWHDSLSTAGLAAVGSILASVGSSTVGDKESASLVSTKESSEPY